MKKTSFWPVYDSYCRAIEYIESRSLQIVDLLTKTGNTVDRKEDQLYAELLKNEALLAKCRQRYFKKFSKALNSARANEFMTLDDSMRILFRLEFMKNTPVVVMSQEAVFAASSRRKR